MRRWLLALLILIPAPASAEFNLAYWQTFSSRAIREFNNALTAASRFGAPRYTTALAPTCNAQNEGAIIFNTTEGEHQSCNGSAYVAMAGGGGGGGTCPNAIAGQVLFQSGTDCAGDTDLTFATATLLGTNITGGTLLNAVGPNGTANSVYFAANTIGSEGATADTNDFVTSFGNHTATRTLTITAGTHLNLSLDSGAIYVANIFSRGLPGTASNFYVNGTDATDRVRVNAAGQYAWTGTGDASNATVDTGLERLAAGVIAPTNASTGVGWIQMQAGRSSLGANFTNATTTMANTALSITVAAGRKYTFRMSLFAANSVAADGAKIDFDGGTATATDFRVHCTVFDTALLLSSQATALATDFAVATMTGASMIECYGSFEPSGAGTFIVRAAENATTTGTLTVNRGSHIWAEDVP